jgi:pyruvate kinase
MPAIEKASALVVEEGGLTSHAAVVAIAQGIPVIVGVENATSVIENDMIITIDPRRGNIFKGESAF